MRTSNHGFPRFSVLVLGTLLALQLVNGALVDKFYKKSCPRAEDIVRDVTSQLTESNPALAAQLLRLHYHDCFVLGCDASILLDTVGGIPSEKEARPNLSLLGFDAIDTIKSEVESACPGIVSCADILALAARDAVSFTTSFRHGNHENHGNGKGNGKGKGKGRKDKNDKFENRPLWSVFTGRRDGRVSQSSAVTGNLPSPFSNFTTLKQNFEKKGLNVMDLVILSGAHTIGVAHCGSFSRRLYNFTGIGDSDPSLNPQYAKILKIQCPNPADASITVEMDPNSSRSFDTDYFDILTQNKGLFQSDAALLTDTSASSVVMHLQNPRAFFIGFANSMFKMGAIEVLTGTDGEIRNKCRIVN